MIIKKNQMIFQNFYRIVIILQRNFYKLLEQVAALKFHGDAVSE